jgi:hypothetical protein
MQDLYISWADGGGPNDQFNNVCITTIFYYIIAICYHDLLYFIVSYM